LEVVAYVLFFLKKSFLAELIMRSVCFVHVCHVFFHATVFVSFFFVWDGGGWGLFTLKYVEHKILFNFTGLPLPCLLLAC
jgi:hypothetical protein